ncbi:kef-type K+ transport systems, predicted NAD-binding component [Candidatus Scalindua japonica]|uniref:Kef-type K+ transport systems, predicted NAD-binding component n=1 Tax=Candidatus Scalindua japonica TaxID=1284222 RepID=A0A286TWE7_9BACT|nr:potassium channel protein [Candidatus Scalindua japonica]GAX60202.1 kef-type K+ transport systems, predicted NAD-binding component [Candidatus Scalindua japonica]
MHFKNRLIKGLIATLIAITAGTAGYKFLGGTEWSLLDSIYMTIITITTVGFGEIQDLSGNPYARILTIFIIFFGMGSILFVVSTVTGFIVEGELTNVFGRRRMLKEISVLKNHFIVCGIGDIGSTVVKELKRTKRDFVVVDTDSEKLEKLNETEKILFINDDATNDDVLINAGIHKAHGLITILPDDKDNLFVTLTAKQLNPDLRIVSKGLDKITIKKLKMAGADSVVLPNFIGGLRMVSELVRPAAVSFLDKMLRTQDGKTYRIEEFTIPANSKLIGKTLSEANLLRNTRVLIVAMKGKEEDFIYNPESTSIIKDETVIVVLGESLETKRVRELVENQ